MTNADTITTHKFTEAGLGQAPFRFAGFRDTAAGADENGLVRKAVGGVEMITKPGGSCDYCGNYITQFCFIVSADGNRFKVGTTCVEKTGDKGLMKRVKSTAAKARRKAAKAREAKRIEAARAAWKVEGSTLRASFEGKPHPSPWLAEQGKTFADYIEWSMGLSDESPTTIDGTPIPGAGHSGQIKLTRLIEKAQKGGE